MFTNGGPGASIALLNVGLDPNVWRRRGTAPHNLPGATILPIIGRVYRLEQRRKRKV